MHLPVLEVKTGECDAERLASSINVFALLLSYCSCR